MYPSDFADCGEPVRYTLLAALCWTRQAELVDGLMGTQQSSNASSANTPPLTSPLPISGLLASKYCPPIWL